MFLIGVFKFCFIFYLEVSKFFCMFEFFSYSSWWNSKFIFCFTLFCMIFEVLFFFTGKHILFRGLSMLGHLHHWCLVHCPQPGNWGIKIPRQSAILKRRGSEREPEKHLDAYMGSCQKFQDSVRDTFLMMWIWYLWEVINWKCVPFELIQQHNQHYCTSDVLRKERIPINQVFSWFLCCQAPRHFISVSRRN